MLSGCRCLFLFIAVIAMCACVSAPYASPPTLDCLDILQPEFRNVLGVGFASREELEAWINSAYDVDSEGIEAHLKSEPVQAGLADVFSWSTSEQGYSIDAMSRSPFAMWGGWKRSPSVSQAIECLGEPTSYIADYRQGFERAGPIVILDLFYPELGEVVTINVDLRSESAPEDSSTYPLQMDVQSTPVVRFRISKPATSVQDLLDEYLDNAVAVGGSMRDEEVRQWYYSMVRPWPGDMNELVYETVPGP